MNGWLLKKRNILVFGVRENPFTLNETLVCVDTYVIFCCFLRFFWFGCGGFCVNILEY